MRVQIEELKERLPRLVPMFIDFEDAVLWIKKPLEALEGALLTTRNSEHQIPKELICTTACTIEIFLDQLEYIIDHSFIGDTSIVFSKIRHPFEIKATNEAMKGTSFEGLAGEEK